MREVETKNGGRNLRTLRSTLLVAALLFTATDASAFPVQMTPNPVSTGIQDPVAAINVALTQSSLLPGPQYVEFTVEGFFIDPCCDYLLDFGFSDAVVSDMELEVLASPTGGTAVWDNPSASPISLATARLTCQATPEDNVCLYRIRLTLDTIAPDGTIQGIPVAYDVIPPVPLLPLAGRVLLTFCMSLAGLLAIGRSRAS